MHRLVLQPPYVLRDVHPQADLVVVGNPTNPTGVLHEDLARLCRPGRTVVVDEAFVDFVIANQQPIAEAAQIVPLTEQQAADSKTKLDSFAG